MNEMKAYRKSTLNFGLFFKIPIRVSSKVVEQTGNSLMGICPHCKNTDGIANIATCKNESCKTIFKSNRDPSLLKAYKFSGNDITIISAEQRENLKNHIKQEIVIMGKKSMSKIDYRNFTGKGYYLIPQNLKGKKTENTRAYLTVYEGLRLSNMALVVKYAVTKDKEHLGLVIPHFDESTNTKCMIIKETCYGEQLKEFTETYEEDQIPNELEEQAGMSFVRKLDEIDPSTIANDFSLKFDEILKNPDQISIEVEEKETKGSAMDMFAMAYLK